MTRISLIAAVSEDGFIGRDGDIPWHIKGDWKFFKAQTLHKPIIMGRVTFETLPESLPQRDNIVITRQKDWQAPKVLVRHDLAAALDLARSLTTGEIMVIGGENVYREALPLADRLYLTAVHMTVGDGDARFPDFDKSSWKMTSSTFHEAAAGDSADYTINIYDRI